MVVLCLLMDTNKLLHFKVLSQTVNVREAADILNISHAGLSKSIKTLERELGADLITKDGRGIKITDIGNRLLKNVDQVLRDIDDLKSIANNLTVEEEESCRIGTFEVFSTYFAPQLSDSLPDAVKLSFTELFPGEIEQELIKGNIDYGISYLPVPSPSLDHLKVTSVEMAIYGTKAFKSVSFEELPFVIPITNVEGTPTKAKGLDGWRDDVISRKVKYHVSLMESALALVREGYAVGYFPKFIAKKHNEIVNDKFYIYELETPEEINHHQDVYLIKRKSFRENTVGKKIAKAIRSLV